mmetsp:Transcript_587/g.396  ORF Transcript_587/g.396 Transcript_587/m.396 type:complete len:180 (-) Transcript_587:2961-3500(-)
MVEKSNEKLNTRLNSVKILLLDVDGVLTEGSIIYDDKNIETKAFNTKDGLGIKLLMEAGIQVGIVTGRRSNSLLHRCNNLGINLIFDGVSDKEQIIYYIEKKTNIDAKNMAFVGDDLPDIPIMKRVGISVAVSDANKLLIEFADIVTKAKGGKGAVREICEVILKAKGLWAESVKRFIH